MPYVPSVTQYFDWLVHFVWENRSLNDVNYHMLFTFLFNEPFVPTTIQDEARASDAISMRHRFEHKFGDMGICDICPTVNMLEMMVALAYRMEDSIMADNDYGDRTGQWFWEMVCSLGLGGMSDRSFNEAKARAIMDRFDSRGYSYNGEGGLFTIPKELINDQNFDMRKLDIWYQMHAYITTVLHDQI